MNRPWLPYARAGFASLALVAVAAQLGYVIEQGNSIANFLSYFTIESNLFASLVLLVVAVTAWRGGDTERLAIWRGAATLFMVVTGVVYFLLLRNVDVQTSEPWINAVLHYLMPVVLLIDWLYDRPRQKIALGRAMWWLAFPVAYLVYSLGRGSLVNWYPYPFIDPRTNNYETISLTALILLGFASLLVVGLVSLTGRLPARQRR